MSIQTSPPILLDDIEYPESDGKPMSDNMTQWIWIAYLKLNFDWLFRDRPDVLVASDLLWYPVYGNSALCAAPDTLIVFGRPKDLRRSYLQWLEDGIAPQVVWEVLSPSNRPGELQEKFEFYERHGVEEYYQYDPDRGELRGWLRDEDQLRAIPAIRGWKSPRTAVRMDLAGLELVLTDPDGKPFKNYDESRKDEEEERFARQAAEELAEHERQEKEAAVARAEHERQEKEAAVALAERRAAKLRALGIDPDAV